jgi:hypothetical protein
VCVWLGDLSASVAVLSTTTQRASERASERESARVSEGERERYLIEVVGLIHEQLNLLPPFQHLCHIFCACVCACECNVWALDRCSSGDIGERTDSVDTPSAYHQHPNANAHLSARYSTTQTILGSKKHGVVVREGDCSCCRTARRGKLSLLSALLLCESGALLVVAQQPSSPVTYYTPTHTHTNINGACVGLCLTIYKDNDNTHVCTYVCVHVCMHVIVRVCVSK